MGATASRYRATGRYGSAAHRQHLSFRTHESTSYSRSGMCLPGQASRGGLASAMSLIGWRIAPAATSATVEGCQSEEVEFMASATVKRMFEVDAPLAERGSGWPRWSDGRSGRPISPRWRCRRRASSVPPQAVPCTSSGWGATPSACRSGSRQCVGSGSAGWLGSASSMTIGSSRRARQRPGWNGWSSSMGPWRRSFALSSPECMVAISTGRSPDCRSGFRR
jgi:hypothetical protein